METTVLPELKVLLEIVALVLGAIVTVLIAGMWVSRKHAEIIASIKNVFDKLHKHMTDEEALFERVERRQDEHHRAIKELRVACINGKKNL